MGFIGKTTVEDPGDPGSLGQHGGVADGVAEPKEEPGEAAGYFVGRRHYDEAHEEGEKDAAQQDVGELS